MNSLLLSSFLLVLTFGYYCSSSPTCCHKPHYYADFLLTLKCGLSLCKTQEKTYGNLCISCIPKETEINRDIALSPDAFKISKPRTVCQDIDSEKITNSSHLILSWTWHDSLTFPSIFTVEIRNFSKQIGEWDFVGMTNETFADFTNLEHGYEYQFRITPIVPYQNTLIPVLSNWVSLTGFKKSLSAPKNLNVTKFRFKENFVEAIVKWNASEEIPCSYKLYWLPVMNGDYFEQRTVTLPQDELSAVLPALSFETNYTLTVSPYDSTHSLRVESAEVWFVTPSCLELTGGNFSLCAPGTPINVTAQWLVSRTEVLVTWLPPLYTSTKNDISRYCISVVETSGVFGVYKNRTNLFFEKNTTSAVITGLKPTAHYVFEVRAISEGGSGLPGCSELNVRGLSIVSLPDPGIPYQYIVPGILVPIVLVIFVVVWIRYCRRVSKKLGYPSGLADVDDDMRIYLIPADKIEVKEVVGQGAFGIVHRGIFTRNKTKNEVAVKVFPSETITRQHLLHEVEVLRLVGRHNHIVQLIGFTFDIEKMFLILEYCKLGNLHSYLVNLKPELMYMKSIPSSERANYSYDKSYGKRLCSYIYQIAQGMEYISSLKLIHRDVAARNILMCSENTVKIGDFGLSKDVYQTKLYQGQTQKMLPIRWMAPEAIERQKFTTYADVWSFGVLMWEIFKLGKEPYPGLPSCNILQYLKMGFRLEQPHCSQEWYDIMFDCWKMVPRERPRFKELVNRISSVIELMTLYVKLS